MATLGRKQVIINADSKLGDVITVQTRNTSYTLEVKNPDDDLVLISGGWRWPTPIKARIECGHIEVGQSMFITEHDTGKPVVSSYINSISVERP